MTNERCPHCNGQVEISIHLQAVGKTKGFKNAVKSIFRSSAPAQAATVAAPTRPPKSPDLVSHRLRQAGVLGLLITGLGIATIVNLGPFEGPVLCGGTSILVCYAISLLGTDLIDRAIWWAERRTKKDWNRDGATGQPPATERSRPPTRLPRPQERPTVETAASPLHLLSPDDGNDIMISYDDLWNVLLNAFEAGKWGRRHWVGEGLGARTWAAIRKYVIEYDDDVTVWETSHSPTLRWFLAEHHFTGEIPVQTTPNQTKPCKNRKSVLK